MLKVDGSNDKPEIKVGLSINTYINAPLTWLLKIFGPLLLK